MTDTVPSSGLSAERLEEIEAMRDAIRDDATTTAKAFRRGIIMPWQSDHREQGTPIDRALSDLLAEVRRLQGELAAAREETAQAVRGERRCCAQIADDEASKSDDIDAGYLSAQRIARKIRSRSLPGETADA